MSAGGCISNGAGGGIWGGRGSGLRCGETRRWGSARNRRQDGIRFDCNIDHLGLVAGDLNGVLAAAEVELAFFEDDGVIAADRVFVGIGRRNRTRSDGPADGFANLVDTVGVIRREGKLLRNGRALGIRHTLRCGAWLLTKKSWCGGKQGGDKNSRYKPSHDRMFLRREAYKIGLEFRR